MTDAVRQKREKKPSNFALEQYGEKSSEGFDTWFQVKDGFVSPEKAIEWAEGEKIKGMVRVIRVVSPVFEGDVVTPEPVYTLRKIKGDSDKVPKKRGRKKASSQENVQSPENAQGAGAESSSASAPENKDEAIPPDPDAAV